MSDTQNHYIPTEWLDAVAGKTLFYPCAGADISEPIAIFAPFVSELWFVDLGYPAGLRLQPALQPPADFGCTLKDTLINGDPFARMEQREGHRFLLPSRRIETYSRPDGSSFRIVRRRGFGEIALGTEFIDKSIGVFFYRCDGSVEGGSGAQFFVNNRRHYSPLNHMFSLLCRKLADAALIVTDGSNTSPIDGLPISQFRKSRLSGADAFEVCRGRDWLVKGLRWTCVGFVGRRSSRAALVWAVVRA